MRRVSGAHKISINGNASELEATAIAVAIRRFRDDHAPMIVPAGPTVTPWQRAALLEGVDRDPGPVAH